MKTHETLPACAVMIFTTSAEMNDWLTAHPESRVVTRAIGPRAAPGELRVIVATYPTTHAKDSAHLAALNADFALREAYTRETARQVYLRKTQNSS